MEFFGYQTVDHTADLALLVRARDLPGLMSGAVVAMLSEMFEGYPPDGGDCITGEIEVEGLDLESLLVNLLNEVLYRAEVCHRIPASFDALCLNPCRVRARVAWMPVRNLVQVREIKAATYHGLKVRSVPGSGWDATIIFDL